MLRETFGGIQVREYADERSMQIDTWGRPDCASRKKSGGDKPTNWLS